ncbi:MAG TPA: M17 family peptidase N-terminal domain-containing protein, partial [Albitalea sp.]|nr:M17 family peptidase N-terminal domain-containing protein [Albitalea sp.]
MATDALLVVVHGEALDPALDPAIAAVVKDAVAHGDFQFKAGRTLYLHRPQGLKAARLVVAAANGPTVKGFKSAVAGGLGLLKGGGAKSATVVLGNGAAVTEGHAEALTAAAADATYLYRQTKPSAPAAPTLAKFTLLCGKAEARDVQRGLARGAAVVEGVTLARELANLPANHCTPTYLGEIAKQLGKDHGLKVEVLDRKAIEKLGMGSFLAVAQGSHQEPRFIVARYDGAGKTQAPVVLVGKGITFDTGGISLKPAAEMDEMKYDMCGAGTVLGVMQAVAQMKLKLNVIGVVAAAENMPSGTATRPGDIVTTLSGQTVEILNTDAEGRLILCDALTYSERFNP